MHNPGDRSATPRVLLSGGTGKLGTGVAMRLVARGVAVTALVRTDTAAKTMTEIGCATVTGDLRDLASLHSACRGMTHVITTANAFLGRGSSDPKHIDLQGNRNLIDAARASGVRRFLFVSAANIAPGTIVDFFRYKKATEAYLKASGLEYVIIQPTAFMDIWGDIVAGKIAGSGVATVFGDGTNPVNFVARDDIADLIADIMDDSSVVNETIVIGGPENLTLLDVVAKYESHTGRTAKRKHVPLAAMRALRILLRPINPVVSRMMAGGIEMATTDQRFDSAALNSRFPAVHMQSMDSWLKTH